MMRSYRSARKPSVVPLFSFVQFRTDDGKYKEDVGVKLHDWGTWMLPQSFVIASNKITQFVYPRLHCKDPISFSISDRGYTEKTHKQSHPFVQAFLANKWTVRGKVCVPMLSSLGVRKRAPGTWANDTLTCSVVPFLTFSWDEHDKIFMEYNEIPLVNKSSLIIYNLTGKFALVPSVTSRWSDVLWYNFL